MVINHHVSMWGSLICANIFLANGEFVVSGAWFGLAVVYCGLMIFKAATK